MSMMDGLWSAWMFLPPLLWAGLIGILIWVLAMPVARRPEPVGMRGSNPEETLRKRLACGEISVREYEEALALARSDTEGSWGPRNLSLVGTRSRV